MGDNYKTYGLDDILSSIKKAKENDDIKGIYIEATSLGAGFASREEIRNALKDFKKSENSLWLMVTAIPKVFIICQV